MLFFIPFHLTYLLVLFLESTRQHVGKELEGEGKQELHEGHDDEDGEGHETEQVGRRPHHLVSVINIIMSYSLHSGESRGLMDNSFGKSNHQLLCILKRKVE